MLISFIFSDLKAQVDNADTLKKVTADTLTAPEDTGEGLEERVTYSAEDSTVGLPNEGKVFLYGKAKIDYGSMNMQAEYIEIDYNSNIISAYGRKDSAGRNVGTPVFRDGDGTPMEAEKIIYNLKSKRGKIYNALTKQGELLVVGNEIKKDSSNIIYMKDMKCIPCADEDARTVFRANKAKIIPDDKIVTGPMYLEVGGVPTPLGLPFGYFPNTKKQADGILLPTYGNSQLQGFYLRGLGYYLGINNKTDMIISGDVYTNGSYMASLNNRYNFIYKARGETFLKFSHFNFGDRDIPAEFTTQRAYEIRWQHEQDNKSNPTLRFAANVNYRTNQQFNRLNAVNSEQFLQNNFLSNINLSKIFKFGALSVSAMHDQNAQTRVMNITFPTVAFNVNSFYPFKNPDRARQNVFDKIRVLYTLDASNRLQGTDTNIFKGAFWHRTDYGIRQNLPVSTNFNILKYITATPAINLSSIAYTKYIEKKYYPPGTYFDNGRDTVVTQTRKAFSSINDANFTTQLSTQVYFDYLFSKTKVKQIRHLLIPSLNYMYRPDYGPEQKNFWKEVQLDSTGRFGRYSVFERSIYGAPQVGEQNSLGIGLNNNVEAKIKQRTDTGITFRKVVAIQNISANTSYNFAADSFQMSTINLSARTKLFKYFDVTAGSVFDPYAYDNTSNRRLANLTYESNGKIARLVNASFAVNTAIGSDMLQALKKTREAPKMSSGAERGIESELDPQEKLPWNINAYYTLNLNNLNATRLQPDHNLRLSGEVRPTRYWKLGVSTGFNFLTQTIEYTRVTIYRDLKCWQAQIDWVPFGISRSYNVSVNLKTSMLSEFRIPRQRQWFDNFR